MLDKNIPGGVMPSQHGGNDGNAVNHPAGCEIYHDPMAGTHEVPVQTKPVELSSDNGRDAGNQAFLKATSQGV